MKIAVASEQEMVSGHFGHCSDFNIFEVDQGKIVSTERTPSPGHASGALPEFLQQRGVTVVISGGMGAGAMERLREKAMEVVSGASGTAKAAVEAYLAGGLQSIGVTCKGHQHHGDDHHGHEHHGECGSHGGCSCH